tara:strand:+ start:303 stop:803 length:501 start_codon:yes stop_codon:yes gene_type:complete
MNYKYITGKKSSLALDKMTENPYLIYDTQTRELEYKDQYNFVIGSKNPKGLKLRPKVENNMITASYIFQPEHVGPPNITHGGVLSAICDDVMGLICFSLNRISMTVNLNVNYLQPVYLNKEYHINAWLVEIVDKKIKCESIIYHKNQICIEASGLFYLYDKKVSKL